MKPLPQQAVAVTHRQHTYTWKITTKYVLTKDLSKFRQFGQSQKLLLIPWQISAGDGDERKL